MKFMLLTLMVSFATHAQDATELQEIYTGDQNADRSAFTYSSKSRPVEVSSGKYLYHFVEFHNPSFKSDEGTFETLAIKKQSYILSPEYAAAAEVACQSVGMEYGAVAKSDLELDLGERYIGEAYGKIRTVPQTPFKFYAVKSFKCKKLIGYWSTETRFHRIGE